MLDYSIEILAEEAEYNLFHNIVVLKITASVTSTRLMKSQALWGYEQEGTILRFPSLNTILIRRLLSSEPCTIIYIYRMCSSGLSYSVSQCVLNVLTFITSSIVFK